MEGEQQQPGLSAEENGEVAGMQLGVGEYPSAQHSPGVGDEGVAPLLGASDANGLIGDVSPAADDTMAESAEQDGMGLGMPEENGAAAGVLDQSAMPVGSTSHDVTAMAGVAGDVVSLGDGDVAGSQARILPARTEDAGSSLDYAVQPTMTTVNNGDEADTLSTVPAPTAAPNAEPDEYEGEGDDPAPPPPANGDADMLREQQDRFLPIANVSRIMKMALPSQHGKIARDAKECVQEAVSEFVSFITSEASDRCLSEKRKTITSDDIIVAMQTLGFDNYIDPLRQYIANYRYAMNKSKGVKRTADDSKETDGADSGFAFPEDNAAAAHTEPPLSDQATGGITLMDPDAGADGGDAAGGSSFGQQDTAMFTGMD